MLCVKMIVLPFRCFMTCLIQLDIYNSVSISRKHSSYTTLGQFTVGLVVKIQPAYIASAGTDVSCLVSSLPALLQLVVTNASTILHQQIPSPRTSCPPAASSASAPGSNPGTSYVPSSGFTSGLLTWSPPSSYKYLASRWLKRATAPVSEYAR